MLEDSTRATWLAGEIERIATLPVPDRNPAVIALLQTCKASGYPQTKKAVDDMLAQVLRADVDDAREVARMAPMVSLDTSQDQLALDLGTWGWNGWGRYVEDRGHFLFWDGKIWNEAGHAQSFAIVRDFIRTRCQEISSYARQQAAYMPEKEGKELIKWAERIQKELRSKANIAALHSLMQSHVGAVVTHKDLNADKLKLGTPNGTVDLRTGQLMHAVPGDLITKTAAVAPAPAGTPTPVWDGFLRRVLDNDVELIAFLQRMAGYALTGLTTEHKFAFLYGTGRNGKGTFLNTLMGIMDEYSRKAPSSVFLMSRNAEHSTDVAGLMGARLVMGGEIDTGCFWNETMLKDATGGDILTARFMRQDFFDFLPEFFLMIGGNNKPALRTTDQAIRDRLLLVPFTQYIPKEERDPNLPEKLQAEWPAILRWMIDGCLMWQQQSLNAPESVVSASQDYIDGEDFLGQFLNESFSDADLAVGVSAVGLENDYNTWRQNQGLQNVSKIKVRKELEKRGYEKRKLRLSPNSNPVSCYKFPH